MRQVAVFLRAAALAGVVLGGASAAQAAAYDFVPAPQTISTASTASTA